MNNPYSKYLGPEDHLQHQLITWLQWQHPSIRYHHSPNEGKRSPFEQFKFKYLGSDSGFPDLIFPSLLLVIELKIKPNKPTEAQKDWLGFFTVIGWKAEVCYTFEEATRIIIEEVKKKSICTSECI
jgi:hypothetical protein